MKANPEYEINSNFSTRWAEVFTQYGGYLVGHVADSVDIWQMAWW